MRKLMLACLGGVILAGCSGASVSESPISPANSTETVSAAESTSSAAEDSAQAVTATEAAYFEEGGVAIAGADPVAYFTESAYVPGRSEFTHDWQGVTWQFVSAENRDAFAADPEAYAPEYGGFCAYAVSQGYTAEIEPEAWTVVDDKLYLNFNKKVQRIWEKDIPGYIAAADQNWPGVLN